jgi:hypothetical protein
MSTTARLLKVSFDCFLGGKKIEQTNPRHAEIYGKMRFETPISFTKFFFKISN